MINQAGYGCFEIAVVYESTIPQLRTFSSIHKICDCHIGALLACDVGLGHVWTAFWQELSNVSAASVGFGHMSGLSIAAGMAAGPNALRGLGR
jgi:hypothetical protein